MTTLHKLTNTLDAIHFLNKFRGNTFLIKLGGSILHNEQLIESLCFDLKLLKQAGINLIIVHGGSKAIAAHLKIHNITSYFLDGLRVTSKAAMEIIEMVLCGNVNKLLVRKLNQIGISAIGLSGTDQNMLLCDYYSLQHEYVGVIKSINLQIFKNFYTGKTQNFTAIPVIAPVGVNSEGLAMNINADHAASELAIALPADKLIYLTDQDGIYDSAGNIYSELTVHQLENLIKTHVVQGGMLTKVQAILSALKQNLKYVHILNGNKKNILIEEIFTAQGNGTLCQNNSVVSSGF